MSHRLTAGLLLSLILTVTPAFAQFSPNTQPSRNQAIFSISGTVRDESTSQTLPNVVVVLQGQFDNPINTTYTREGGKFEFDSLVNGEYAVVVNYEGFDPAKVQVTIHGASMPGLNVDLRKVVTQGEAKPTGPISAHQLRAPAKAHTEYDKGMKLMYSKLDYSGAIVQFQLAIKDFPAYYEAYEQKGVAELQLGNTAAAEEALRKSIEISAGHYPDAVFALAGLLNNGDRYAEAETASRQGITLDATSWRGHLELARALVGLKNPAEAEKSALESRNLKPDNPQVFLVLANIHIELDKPADLIDDLNGYLKLVPDGPEADQARKARDQLQASRQKAQDQSAPVQSQ